ncbi:DUF6157 family protein [Arthrobacter oryzae]|uniref:DUF6157 family protein n=1 Tax=Arthrobacter oryzae TaxID=409290 RepID=UPI001C838999|nr:DUF6157 family protein [Arthrobacter oryzae]
MAGKSTIRWCTSSPGGRDQLTDQYVSIDAPAVPPTNAAKPTVAALRFDLLAGHPYELTSDEILFAVHAIRAEIPKAAIDAERARFLAKDQACLRASPLGSLHRL